MCELSRDPELRHTAQIHRLHYTSLHTLLYRLYRRHSSDCRSFVIFIHGDQAQSPPARGVAGELPLRGPKGTSYLLHTFSHFHLWVPFGGRGSPRHQSSRHCHRLTSPWAPPHSPSTQGSSGCRADEGLAGWRRLSRRGGRLVVVSSWPGTNTASRGKVYS